MGLGTADRVSRALVLGEQCCMLQPRALTDGAARVERMSETGVAELGSTGTIVRDQKVAAQREHGRTSRERCTVA